MKKLLTASIAALLLSTSASYAQEDQEDHSGNEEIAFAEFAGDEETSSNNDVQIALHHPTSNGHCRYKGHIVRVSVYPEPKDSYVYFRSYARSHVLYQAKVDDERLLNAAFRGLNGPVYVEIKTDRSCASKGGSGERFVGYIDYLALNP